MIQPDVPTAVGDESPLDRSNGKLGLLGKLRRGDPAAATELVERYAARAYRIALVITRDAEDAGDVVQNAVWNVLRNVDTFRNDAALASWLYRIVTNAACQRARPAAHPRADIALEDVLPPFHEDGAPVVIDDWSLRLNDRATVDRARAALNAAIDELSPDYRAVVVLRDAEGLTLAETARSLGINVAGVKTRLHRARLFLRKRLTAGLETAA
jgi:RNA polymerase sigma-70 factor, ECF subfamily